MNKAKKYSERLDVLKWFWCIPAAVIYAATQIPFGRATAFGLALCFGAGFFLICSRGRMHIISEDIVKDVKESLKALGQENTVFEVKGFSFGLVVRVYLYRANLKTPVCTKAIMEKLSKGWYKNLVWVAQVVDVAEESQLKRLQKELDQALLDTLESERGKKK